MRHVVKESAEGVILRLDSRVYAVGAVHAAAFSLSERLRVLIELTEGDGLLVSISPRAGAFDSPASAADAFVEALGLEQVRLRVEEQVRGVRETIVRHALAPAARRGRA